MPSPRMNWLLTQLAVFLSAIGSAVILVFFHERVLPLSRAYAAVDLLLPLA